MNPRRARAAATVELVLGAAFSGPARSTAGAGGMSGDSPGGGNNL